MSQILVLSRGKLAQVDDEFIATNKWSFDSGTGYAVRGIGGRTNPKKQYLHRFIMNAGPGQLVDHINRDRLDNRKSNLRFVTKSENNYNKGLRSDNKLRVKGVCMDRGRFLVQFKEFNARTYTLGEAKALYIFFGGIN